MPQLGSFRKGWESENLARFILSKFSFVAQPFTVSDDIGSDFFCTLFKTRKEGRHRYLIPKNSFAIQIKSNMDNLDVSNKLEYLANLEVPFFVGVIDRKELKLSIYSGEYMPAFFSYKGLPKRLKIQLCERVDLDRYFAETKNQNYILKFPKIAEVGANIDPIELQKTVQTLCEVCSLIHTNIASRKSGEYIFEVYKSSTIMMFAGCGSARVFRENFRRRLAEVFYNLTWIYQNNRQSFNMKEFRIYERFFYQLKGLHGTLPEYLTKPFYSLKTLIHGDT